MAKLPPVEIFEKYEEEIASNPAYAGMPDLRFPDGHIQWEAPSNRKSGAFRDSHDKRLAWWKRKAEEVGVSINEDKWISKVAKLIHPTKRKPCKVCGRVMDIRYCYLNSQLMNAIRKLPYVGDELDMDECTSILDFVVDFESLYGRESLNDLGKILRCKAVPDIPSFNNVDAMIDWLNTTYIPAEPSRLSPGAMSNAPDRLDGFHTYNRCCRHKADKGRSKSNLASYSTDRRAFEYWVDGNWVQANMTMGLFRSNPDIKAIPCMNSAHDNNGNHPLPCAADHIGPISLGFAHRPAFQPLCNPCNSAKNNRMYYSDVQKLILAEKRGESVASWYAVAVWNILKNRVSNSDDAVKLSRILRDNRHNAMLLLERLLRNHHMVFLTSLLNLSYADYTYDIVGWTLDSDSTISAEFDAKPSDLEYSRIKKARRIRVAFQALHAYAQKQNRNGLEVEFSGSEALYSAIEDAATRFETPYLDINDLLAGEIEDDFEDAETLKDIAHRLPSKTDCDNSDDYRTARRQMASFMERVGSHLANMWDDPRFSRTDYDGTF